MGLDALRARRLASALSLGLAVALLADCVTVTAINNPTPPAASWVVYSSVETGVALAMPSGWRAFDLTKEREAVLRALTSEGTDSAQASAALADLERSGSRFVAIGPTPYGGAAFAYVVFTARPPEGRDAYVGSRNQTAGRSVVLVEHIQGNAGDILHQRVRTTDAGGLAGLQDQFFVERFERLYVLFIQYQERAGPEFARDMTTEGSTFTPIR